MMTTYDFDKQVDRRDTDCVKWDEPVVRSKENLEQQVGSQNSDSDIIPLWVADMDFETAPCVQKALIERMQHGCFGFGKGCHWRHER